MAASSPRISSKHIKALRNLGQRVRARRKQLGISAVATAEAAGMSRVTLHRIEQGEETVSIGAYISAISSLGLSLELINPQDEKRDPNKMLPTKIRLSDYPQLKRLAWQLKDIQELSREEALDLYERNWKHVNVQKMTLHEKELLENLLKVFGRKRLLV